MRGVTVVLVLSVFAGFCGSVGVTITRYTKPRRPWVSGFIATLLGTSVSVILGILALSVNRTSAESLLLGLQSPGFVSAALVLGLHSEVTTSFYILFAGTNAIFYSIIFFCIYAFHQRSR